MTGGSPCLSTLDIPLAQAEAGFAIPNLPVGSYAVIQITATVSATSGPVSITGAITAPAGVTDPNPGNNTYTKTVTVSPGSGSAGSGGASGGGGAGGGTADLSVTITGTGPNGQAVASFSAGETPRYSVEITNNGPGAADNAVLAVPATAPWYQVTCYGESGAMCTFGGQSVGAWGITRLPAGGLVHIGFRSNVPGVTGTTVGVTATITPPAGVTDPNSANNSSSVTHSVVAGGSTGGGTSPQSATILSLSPNSIEQGVGLSGVMTLMGQGTNWQQGATTVDFGPGINVQLAQVQSPTAVTVQISASYAAAPGPRPVTVTTSGQRVTLANGLTVTPRPQPVITQISPNSAAAGQQNVTLTITGQGTRWAQGVTTVRVSGQGVTLQSLERVNSPTSMTLTVNVDPSAAAGPRDVTVMNTGAVVGSDVITVVGGITVTAAPTPEPATATIALIPTATNFVCLMRGPTVERGQTTPGYVRFEWPVLAGATGYTVSRTDLGSIGSLPPTPTTIPVNGPANFDFSHRARLDYRQTYQYTFTAQYGPSGCGLTTVSFTPPRPESPIVTPTTGQIAGRVRLFWRMPSQSDFTGVLVQGPFLPQEGREIKFQPYKTSHIDIDGVPAGARTWTVTAFWDTPQGRMMDASTGRTITVNVP
jgi:hypothetical protein